MATVEIKDIEERLEHYRRLELAGMDVLGMSTGLPVILWTRDRAGKEAWEILPEWVADLVLADLAQSGGVAKAIIYRKPPPQTPLSVARKWAAQFLKIIEKEKVGDL